MEPFTQHLHLNSQLSRYLAPLLQNLPKIVKSILHHFSKIYQNWKFKWSVVKDIWRHCPKIYPKLSKVFCTISPKFTKIENSNGQLLRTYGAIVPKFTQNCQKYFVPFLQNLPKLEIQMVSCQDIWHHLPKIYPKLSLFGAISLKFTNVM